MNRLELWGGPECTVNRVGDALVDQVRLSGHHDRLDDLDRFAELGLSAIRYPLLWERTAPDDPDELDWGWSDERLERLRQFGLRVVAGLVHHGSGPRYTHLLDPGFATGLGRYADQVAARYPWIEDWTPVNEPVTTARFSALYGHWYPHHRDEGAFWLALLNQVDGTRAAMRAIRAINPAARLIQTDDLGRTYATGPLRGQAAFDNLRRWAGWDLLCGRVTPAHPLFGRLETFGLGDRARAIADDPCPPDVIGVNHYLTSDRFLDHRIGHYPADTHGGNFELRYADVAALRTLEPPPQGLRGALREAWARYGIPLAVTEVHNGCTRDEQLRWMAQAWDTAEVLRDEGVKVRAVTSWALLGSHGWDTLLTSAGGYEVGVFDTRQNEPRLTAVAKLLPGLANGAARAPAATGPGWWQRPIRLLHGIVHRPAPLTEQRPGAREDESPPRPLLICGATGTLGQAFARACEHRGLPYVLTSRRELSIDSAESVDAALARHAPWAVVNAAGWVRVDDAEGAEAACHRANAHGAITLARACAEAGVRCLNFSSDLVFDGTSDHPYLEGDPPTPLSAYGRSKAAAERGLGEIGGQLVIRTAAFFSPYDQHNFAVAAAWSLGAGRRFAAAADHIVSPTFVPHLVNVALDLLIDEAEGVWHLSNGEALSWADFARRIARACALDEGLIDAVPGAALGWVAPRPRYAALGSRRGMLLPSLESGLQHFAAEARIPEVMREAA